MTGFFRDRVLSLALAWTINSLAYSIVYPFIPIYLNKQRGVPYSTVGVIYPLMSGAIILAPMIVGPLIDRIGCRFALQFGQSGRGLVFLLLALMAFCHAPFWFFAAVLALNAGIGTFFQIGADAYLNDITTPADRGRHYGKIRIGTNIGWMVGPMLGAFLAQLPFGIVFMLTAGLCFLGALYTRQVCNYTVLRRKEPESKLSVYQLLGDRHLIGMLFCALLLFFLTSQLYSSLSPFARDVIGISSEALGFIYGLNGCVIILFQLPVIRTLEHLKLSPLQRLVVGALFYLVGYFSIGFALNGWMLAASVVVLTIGEAVVQPSLFLCISRFAPAGGVGRYMAALELTRGIGYAAGPFFGLHALAAFPGRPVLLWGVLSLFAVAAAAGFWLLSRTWLPEP